MIQSMTKKTYWLCDLVGIIGACLFLYGVYIFWNIATVLIVSGAMLMVYASRLTYCRKRDDFR